MPRSKQTTEERFWSKVDRSAGSDGCWLWLACRKPNGYGQFTIGGKHVYAHRWAYTNIVGPIADGLVIDHLCKNRACVNPQHMEVVTQRENLIRGDGFSGRSARTTHCPSGHEYSAENTWFDKDGHRRCRVCNAAHNRTYLAKKRADAPPSAPMTHCKRGHEFTPENTHMERHTEGGYCRRCRTCGRIRAAQYAKRKEVKAA